MKKFLLTSALILALVLSLTAGTMAAYNQTVATLASDTTTREMNIVATDSTTTDFVDRFSIAPGDKITRDIVLNNVGEISATTKLVATLTKAGTLAVPEGMSIKVKLVEATNAGTTVGDDSATVETSALKVGGSVKYRVTVAWEYDDEVQAKEYGNKTFGFNVGVSARSDNEGKENYKVPTA